MRIVKCATILLSNYDRARCSQAWQDYAKQVWDPGTGEKLHYIYYKYFFDSIR